MGTEPEKAAAKRRGRFHVVDEKDTDGSKAAAAGMVAALSVPIVLQTFRQGH